MKLIAKMSFVLAAILCLAGPTQMARAQEDFDKMFEQMMREFFPKDMIDEIDSIREKDADKDSGKSFFRNDPRFLAIKERQIRTRRKDREEKQHPDNLKVYRPLAIMVAPSVFSVHQKGDDDRLCFATAVGREGLLVTKQSELKGLKSVTCIGLNNQEFVANVVKTDDTNDLALLKADKQLVPVSLEKTALEEGTILVSVGSNRQPVAMGTLAVKPRSIIGKNRGFLGVEPGPDSAGVLIKSVTRNSAADRAGVLAGDVVQTINGVATRSVAELVREIGSKKKGDEVALSILRNGRKTEVNANLDGRMLSGERAARFEMMRRLGSILSQRRDEFPRVMQHDTPLLPDECGSPVVDLDGKVIGINIARAGRTSTFALPLPVVKNFVDSYSE